MVILNKKFVSGVASGVAGLFAVFSVLLMNPEQMWRWLFHPDSVDQKVERALSRPSEKILSLERKLLSLQDQIVEANRNEEEKEYIGKPNQTTQIHT